MPLTVSVGLSRKATHDYQSAGTSINVTAELDQGLLARPEELQRQIDELYYQAEDALARNAGVPAAPETVTSGNGATNGKGTGAVQRPMTGNQRRAINAAAMRLCLDPHRVAMDVHGIDLNHLSLRQASALIDHLRVKLPALAGTP